MTDTMITPGSLITINFCTNDHVICVYQDTVYPWKYYKYRIRSTFKNELCIVMAIITRSSMVDQTLVLLLSMSGMIVGWVSLIDISTVQS